MKSIPCPNCKSHLATPSTDLRFRCYARFICDSCNDFTFIIQPSVFDSNTEVNIYTSNLRFFMNFGEDNAQNRVIVWNGKSTKAELLYNNFFPNHHQVINYILDFPNQIPKLKRLQTLL